MAKVRVYELAKEFGVESKVVLAKLNELGESVRAASSPVEAPVVRKLRAAFPTHELGESVREACSPIGTVVVPKLEEAPPRPVAGTDVVIGTNQATGAEVVLPYASRPGHITIVGGTGTGKTTLLERLIRQDITDGTRASCLTCTGT